MHRAADVILKERRRLVLVTRESPLSEVHLENMLKLARMGVTILPPMPAFYNHPQSIADIVDHVVARVLDQLGIVAPFAKRWDGRVENRGKIAAKVQRAKTVTGRTGVIALHRPNPTPVVQFSGADDGVAVRPPVSAQSLQINRLALYILVTRDLFGKPASTRIKSGAGFFRIMR